MIKRLLVVLAGLVFAIAFASAPPGASASPADTGVWPLDGSGGHGGIFSTGNGGIFNFGGNGGLGNLGGDGGVLNLGGDGGVLSTGCGGILGFGGTGGVFGGDTGSSGCSLPPAQTCATDFTMIDGSCYGNPITLGRTCPNGTLVGTECAGVIVGICPDYASAQPFEGGIACLLGHAGTPYFCLNLNYTLPYYACTGMTQPAEYLPCPGSVIGGTCYGTIEQPV